MKYLHRALLSAVVCVVFPGCSQIAGLQKAQEVTDPVTQRPIPVLQAYDDTELAPAPDAQSPYPQQFSRSTLLDLLTAEIAGQRGQVDMLLQNYLKVARETRDIGVIRRALNAAQYIKDDAAMTEMTLLWTEVEPDNVDAHQLAAFQLIKQKQYPEALSHMEQVLELEGPTTFDRLAVHAKNLTDEEKKELLNLYKKILERHPENGELMYGYAVLQEINGMEEAALASTDPLLKTSPDNPAVIALRARLLKSVKGVDVSLAYLKKQYAKHPDEVQVGALYARTQIEAHNFDAAQSIYKELMNRFPNTPHLKLSYALVSLENQHIQEARKHLEELVKQGQHLNEAHFYLARIADQEDRVEDAIQHYQNVTRGGHYFNALARSAYLLIRSGRQSEAEAAFTEARENLPSQASQLWELQINLMLELDDLDAALKFSNQAVEEYPEDLQLLYARAMLKDRMGLLQGMEDDLRHIIALDPDNAVALNALGYTLADRTERTQEAYNLINKALELDPGNPAILDSMGWVLFRLGKSGEAVGFLQEAYSKFPDPEVASHLGEVLWSLGRQDDAKNIWREALNTKPDHQLLNETLKRLNVDL
ncbi:FOG: TPR repeat [Hahella chejuensis KCTC 2396]|uniref:FOG: TPR repeat n=1 Tax=Hahella chejuensis (strain KCTC 2396) TaxID=349521 RepID=Q2SL98_HAHCH|nr:tetratricopeptide repeat protein [Hahella chejuensis]ABC28576.1 FOG: TPR repeat [Hahella chejuensis KCTC 2396]